MSQCSLSMTVPWRSSARELLAAAQSGDAFTVAGLCEFGADANTKDDRGQPIIRLAARRGHAAVVSELAQAGAELEARVVNERVRRDPDHAEEAVDA